MTTLSGKKGLALCILKVLRAHSSSERPLTIAQLEEYIERDFGMEVGRNAISRNLSLLREMHYPIRYIPPQEARELIGKLTSLGRAGFSSGVQDVHAVDKWHRMHHRDFFDCMDGLSRAVHEHLQVRFVYCRIGLEGELVPDGRVRQAHPLALLCAQGQYYLLACYDGSREVRHFRVDHMRDLVVTGLAAMTPYDLPEFRCACPSAPRARSTTRSATTRR